MSDTRGRSDVLEGARGAERMHSVRRGLLSIAALPDAAAAAGGWYLQRWSHNCGAWAGK